MAADVGESLTTFQCNICFELPQEPIVTHCGHLFCWPCLNKWLHIHLRAPKCPVCKAVVQEDKLVPLYGSGKDHVDPRSKNNVPGDAADIPHRGNTMAPQADPNRRMKRKRQRPADGGDTSTRNTTSDDLSRLEVGKQQTEAASRSIYVVVNTWEARRLVYALFKLDYTFDHSCSPTPKRRRLHPLAALEIEGGRTFVSVQTRRRKWIVAVGGRHSIVFDTETEEVIHGPNLLNAKDRPALVAVGDKVYALSCFPKVKGERDFEPWFEVLDLSRARAVDGRLEDCSWEELPSPPCFPCYLSAHEFFWPPIIFVHSYVLVGSYILVSFRSKEHPTYAFHTVSAKWHKVQGSDTLPFIGCPTPRHGGLYLGESAQGKDRRTSDRAREGHPAVISAYSIKLSSCDKGDDIKLSITEFPIRSSSDTCNAVETIHYASLDKGIFCSLDWKTRKQAWRSWDDDILAHEFHYSKKATITLKTYQMEDSSLLQEEKTLPAVKTKKIAISEQPEQAFKIRTKSEGFIWPAFLTVFDT